MKILFIAPLPPPIGGHALVSKVLLDELATFHDVEVVDLKKDNFSEGIDGFKRIFQIARNLLLIWRKKKNVNAIYLTISESFSGNIKDLFIYLICFKYISGMYIHLHGGSIKKLLWDRHRIVFSVNKILIKRFAGVIVSGQSHMSIFDGMIPRKRLHIIQNFAQDYLFLTEKKIRDKFSITKPLIIFFISNFIKKKGYDELVDAYLGLNNAMKKMVSIEFAGRFDSKSQKKAFLEKIEGAEHIRYHGSIDDVQKRTIFSRAHIFCLPTSYFEGQPISILEAYSSGCVVLTTGQDGILDIFKDTINGFLIRDRSEKYVRIAIEGIIRNEKKLLKIALFNRKIAGKYHKASLYNSAIRNIIESQSQDQYGKNLVCINFNN